MASSAEFDIVVYGASGFTGRLVAEYLATEYRGSNLRWAIAGRSLDKLAVVRDAIGAPRDLPLIAADAGDPASLETMVSRTASVLSTVGPYQLYGSGLVAACAAGGTDYLDLCGEPIWMRQMIDAHEAQARRTGARIVFSCGYDSLPFELGVFFLQQAAIQRLGSSVARVKGRVRKMKGTFSGGTAASMRAIFAAAANDPDLLPKLRDPFVLTPGFEGPRQPPGNKPLFDEDIGMWVAPFVMANINTRNVHRSNFLLGFPYGRDFVYDEMMVAGPRDTGEATAKAIIAANNKLGAQGGPKPGEGPSKEERDSGYYDLLFVGLAPDGRQVKAAVTGDRDPGYGSTSKMIAECAICLRRDTPDIAGGFWTPGAAMKDALLKRLVDHAGMTFTIEP
ncbi:MULTISPECIES: trans-acting enoyl reductase family protein [unclassified Nitrobacter]|uniref:saccharopine dehydrogenase family protein n=1 Tax=unclassified Nitrobacter TaxID=2620411 RepID=UPI000928F984|nr:MULTISPECIES: saccharopine dehydrogenase NADP-binding domain-containing protein [unclassified Nitrobacter]MBN9148594.1 saccharopine dehydrogenase NADP-binding domain-containing protein [Nitrobacter sp.]OJV03954.1 MAG: saccharopine dehydrogenase [Nitrobacter sp. 62-23]